MQLINYNSRICFVGLSVNDTDSLFSVILRNLRLSYFFLIDIVQSVLKRAAERFGEAFLQKFLWRMMKAAV